MTHYDLLAVPRDASLETIRTNFQTQMNQWASSIDPSVEQRRHQIQSAYVVLSDPELRATYDARLAQQARDAGVSAPTMARIPTADEIAAYDKQPAAVLALDAFRDQRWAGFWMRFAAQMIDGIILYIPGALAVAIVVGVLSALHVKPLTSLAVGYLAYFLLFALYSASLNSSDALATLGRRAAGMAVVSSVTGEQISFGVAFARGILSLISAMLIFPDLLQLFTDRRQSLSDMIVGTVVVRKRAGGGATVVVVAVVMAFIGIFVIGILAAIAIPAYQDYTVRAHVTEGLSAASAYKSLVAQNASSGANDLSAGFSAPPSTVQVASVEVSQDGTITVTMAPSAKSVAFSLVPSWTSNQRALTTPPPPGGTITWTCRVDTAKNDRYVPSECRI